MCPPEEIKAPPLRKKSAPLKIQSARKFTAAHPKCYMGCRQGLTGRVFQLRVGSGSGIGKNYRVGSGLGSGSGIGNIYWINRVLSGIENLDRVFPYFVIFNSWSTWLDIKFGISYRAYYLFTICIHNKSKTIAGSKFSAPNNIKIVFKSQRQKNRDKSA